nr:MFS transporter [uncultured Caldimonas sp.]
MTAGSAPAAGRVWFVVVLLVGAGVVAAFQVGKVPIALPEIQRDLHLGLASAAWLMAAFAVVGAVAGAPIGLAVDRLGARRVAVASMAVLAAGAALGASVAAPVALLATRVLEGIGFVGVSVAAPALVAAVATTGMRKRAMALWATFMPVGMTLVMLAAPLLGAIGWRGFWVVNAALLLAYACLLARGTRGVGVGAAGSSPGILADVAAAASAPGPWILGGLFAAFSAAYFAMFSFLPTYLAQRLGTTPENASMLSAAAVAASAAGNLLCGHLLAHGARHARLLLAAFGVMALCGVAAFHPSMADAAILPLAVVFSLAGGAIPVVIFDSARRLAPGEHLVGATVGFAMQGNSVGLLVGPVAAGEAVAAFGWQAVGPLIVAIALAALVLVAAFAHRAPHGPATGPLAGKLPTPDAGADGAGRGSARGCA